MDYFINEMSKNFAKDISNWTYKKPYDLYNGDNSDEFIEELLDGSYYVVLDENNELVGFYCFGSSAQVPAGNQYGAYNDKSFIDVGLGMRPDLCGKGNGYDFFTHGLEFAKKKFKLKKFRLTVASFNTRAISLYDRIGFVKTEAFQRESSDGDITFYVMELSLKE